MHLNEAKLLIKILVLEYFPSLRNCCDANTNGVGCHNELYSEQELF